MDVDCVTSTGLFLLFFPRIYLENIIMKQTNENLIKKMDFGEMLVYIALWLVISSSLPGNLNRNECWSSTTPKREGGAPFRLNDVMSGRRFEEITSALSFTD